MKKQRLIELLAPAKNVECGIEAVNHGADAVYIGAPRFGARAAAGNSIEDIAALVAYAHIYNVRIYVTVNTILRDEELSDTEKLIWELYRIGVDALIIQDLGITRLNLPPIPLHASTQMDNRSVQKARFLAEAGFRQIVLARELTLDEIATVLPPCFRHGRCRRQSNSKGQTPTFAERHEPKRESGSLARCGSFVAENRRQTERRGLRKERYGILSEKAGRNIQTPSGICPRVFRTCKAGIPSPIR